MPQRRWTTEEKLEVALAVIRGQESVSQICRRYGVSETAVYRWRDQFLEGDHAGLSGSKGGEVEQLRAERQLRHEDEQLKTIIRELTAANRICMKALQQL